MQQGDGRMVGEYGSALARFFLAQGLWSESDQRLEMATEACKTAGDQKTLAYLYLQRGRIALNRTEYADARHLFTESYEISKQLGDKPRLIPALINLGSAAWQQSDFDSALSRWEEALQLARETQQPRYEAVLLTQLALFASERGELEDAVRYYEEGLTIHKRENNQVDTAQLLMNFSDVLRRQMQFEAAQEKLEESRRLFTNLGNRQGIAMTAIQTATTLLESGETTDVASYAREGLQIAQEIGDLRWEMYALLVQARLAGKEGNRMDARDLFMRSAVIAREVNDMKHLADVLYHYSILLRQWGDLQSAYRLLAVAEREYMDRDLYNATKGNGLLRSLREVLLPQIVQQLDEEAAHLSCYDALLFIK
jgi:tetratricopeptide (TPR) repeat protein